MKKSPNIVVFMTDQQLGDTLLDGSRVRALTPNVDRFRQSARQFTNAFCTAPHCCPSRASFFTGLYPSEHGVWHNVEVCNAISRGVFDGVTMFPETLRQNGYKTFFSGKWHVSAYEGPEDRGFDVVLREYVSNYGRMKPENKPHFEDWGNFYSDAGTLDRGGEPAENGRIVRPGYPTYHQYGEDENPFGDTTTVKLACESIEKYEDEAPFFMYVGATGPHDPYTPPRWFIDMYEGMNIQLPDSFADDLKDKPNLYQRTQQQFKLSAEEHKESLLRYLAFCSYEDYLFGQLLDSLERKGIIEDTIVIYLSDHGDYAGAHGLWAKGLPCFREAYNICALVGMGGVSPGADTSALVSIVDFAPTILELAGLPADGTSGQSFAKALFDRSVPVNNRTEIYTQTNGNELYGIQRAVWDGHWKYVYNGFDFDELYNLQADPQEMHNLINEESLQPVVREYCTKLWRFAREHRDNVTCPYIMVATAPYGPGITLLE